MANGRRLLSIARETGGLEFPDNPCDEWYNRLRKTNCLPQPIQHMRDRLRAPPLSPLSYRPGRAPEYVYLCGFGESNI